MRGFGCKAFSTLGTRQFFSSGVERGRGSDTTGHDNSSTQHKQQTDEKREPPPGTGLDIKHDAGQAHGQ